MRMRIREAGNAMKLTVTEAQGCGNRFVIVDKLGEAVEGPQAELSIALGKRFATDSILLLTRSENADARMRVLEKDGSESDMCGNGIRCVARYLIESHGFDEVMTVETRAGIKTVTREGRDKNTFTVDMGIPVPDEKVWNTPITIGKDAYRLFFVNSGEPHVVTFLEDVSKVDVDRVGREIRNRFGKAGANANFVQILGTDAIRVRTYERGVETETPACGTGATAAVVAAIESGRVKEGRVNVKCNGGNLAVTYKDSDAVLEGPAELSMTQSIDL